MLKVAIIEDDIATNDELKNILLGVWPSCTVLQYFDFESASSGVASTDFDLVISDIDLGPGSDKYGGMKIAKALHGNPTPLLIVSGSPQAETNRELFRALEAWDYLQKPITDADFINQAKRAITYRLNQKNPTPNIDAAKPYLNDPNLVIDWRSREKVKWNGIRVHLPMTQVRIVETLARNANCAVTYKDLFAQLDSGKNKENLRVHIGAIRTAFKEVDEAFDRIRNVTMTGYIWRV